MTRRYFYTDMLAAAYMAKHFGMTYSAWVDQDLYGEQFTYDNDDPLEFIDPNDLLDCAFGVRFILHPDSLPLLGPKEGDKDEGGYIWDGNCWEHPQGMLAPKSETAKRDGKTFFWPESEEV